MKKLVHIKDPVYGADVHVISAATQVEVTTMIKKLAPKWDGCTKFNGVGCTWEFGEEDGTEAFTFLVALKYQPGSPYEISVLVHELLHVTQHVLDGVGMTMNKKTVEAYCYYLDSLVRDVLKGLKS